MAEKVSQPTKKDIQNMKITKSLKERLFVMFLSKEIETQLRLGEAPKMSHAVMVGEEATKHAVEVIGQLNELEGDEE